MYICCFCQQDNLLSQWRSYGANGTGVSIEFRPSEFSNVTGPDSPHGGLMRLWKVFYEPARQEGIVRAAVDFAYTHDPAKPWQDRAQQAADAIQFFIPTFKNQDFGEENECRLIFTPRPDCGVPPQFRVARGMLIPFYSLKALSDGSGTASDASSRRPRHLPIMGIRIGPSAHKQLNAESARMLLLQSGYDVPIQLSETPYRG